MPRPRLIAYAYEDEEVSICVIPDKPEYNNDDETKKYYIENRWIYRQNEKLAKKRRLELKANMCACGKIVVKNKK